MCKNKKLRVGNFRYRTLVLARRLEEPSHLCVFVRTTTNSVQLLSPCSCAVRTNDTSFESLSFIQGPNDGKQRRHNSPEPSNLSMCSLTDDFRIPGHRRWIVFVWEQSVTRRSCLATVWPPWSHRALTKHGVLMILIFFVQVKLSLQKRRFRNTSIPRLLALWNILGALEAFFERQ